MKPFASFFPRTPPQAGQQDAQGTPAAYWSLAPEQLLAALRTTNNGLQPADVKQRLMQYGLNTIKAQQQATALGLFLNQFKSPLVLILIFAAIVSAHCRRVDRCQHCAGRGARQHDARLRAGIPCQQCRRETTVTGSLSNPACCVAVSRRCCPPSKWCQAMWYCSLRAA